MKTFAYTIKDEIGIHARPAGALAKEAKRFESVISIAFHGNKIEVNRMMAVLGLGIRTGDTIMVEIEGKDEETACKEMQRYFEKNL